MRNQRKLLRRMLGIILAVIMTVSYIPCFELEGVYAAENEAAGVIEIDPESEEEIETGADVEEMPAEDGESETDIVSEEDETEETETEETETEVTETEEAEPEEDETEEVEEEKAEAAPIEELTVDKLAVEDIQSAPFTFVVNDNPVTEYTDIVEAVASLKTGDVAIITLTDDIVLPESTPIELANGTLTIDLGGHMLAGEDCHLSAGMSSNYMEAIVYMPLNNSAVLNITGEGEIAARDLTDKFALVYAIYARSGSTVNHKSGKITGCNGIYLESGEFTSSGTYDVNYRAIDVSGTATIDGADITVNSVYDCDEIFFGTTTAVFVSPMKESFLKNTKIRMRTAKEPNHRVLCGISTGYNPASLNIENVDLDIETYHEAGSVSGIGAYANGSMYVKDVNIDISTPEKNQVIGLQIPVSKDSELLVDGVNIKLDGIKSDNSKAFGVNYFNSNSPEGADATINNVKINMNISSPVYDAYVMEAFGDVSNCEIKASGNAKYLYGFIDNRDDSGAGALHTTLQDVTIDLTSTSTDQSGRVYGIYLRGDSYHNGTNTTIEDGVEITTSGKNGTIAAVGFSESDAQYLHWQLAEGCKWVDLNGDTISNDDVTKVQYARSTNGINERYTITYVLDGGTNAPSNPSKYKNTEPISFANASREGYEFGGWYTDKSFADDKKITTTEGQEGNLTIYAKWIPHTYKLVFDANFPAESGEEDRRGTMELQELKVGTEAAITANGFSCFGYKFLGWNTAADGSKTTYADGQKVKDLTLTDGDVITLYAMWESTYYSVTSDAGNYTIGSSAKPAGSKLNIVGYYNASTVFYVKAKAGYVIDTVSYQVGNEEEVTLEAEESDNVNGSKYVIPIKTLTDNTKIIVKVLKTEDLSKATIKAEFENLSYTGSPVTAKSVTVLIGKKEISSDNYTISYINNTDAGTAILRVQAKEGSKAYSGYKDYLFTIEGVRITDSKAVLITASKMVTWNGEGLETKADIILTNKATGNKLNIGEDYLLVYSNNLKPGTAKVTIIGIGGYNGSKDLSFTVTKPSFAEATTEKTIGKLHVSDIEGKYIYDTTARTPEVNVTYINSENEEISLINGKDYSVKYSSNVNVGTAKVTIKGKGNYAGSITKTFKIEAMNLSDLPSGYSVLITAPSAKYKAEGVPVKTSPVVEIRKDGTTVKVLKAGTDYEKLTNDYFSNNDKLTTEAEVKIVGKGNYTGTVYQYYSIANKSIADKNIVISIPKEYTSAVYEGKAVTPKVEVKAKNKDGSYTTINESDYDVQYLNNDRVGRATVKVLGKNEYYGTRSLTFNIVSRKVSEKTGETGILDNLVISMDGCVLTRTAESGLSYDYTGYAITPEIEIVDGGIGDGYSLKLNKDFTLAYKANTNAGKASVTIKFKGVYSGKLTRTYTITPWNISEAEIDIADAVYNNGKAAMPVTTVKINSKVVNPKALKLQYVNNKMVTTGSTLQPKAIIKGASAKNISGTIEKNFCVVKGDLNTVTFSKISPQIFKGTAVTPKFSVLYNKVKLVEGKDYSVSYVVDDKVTNNKKGIATIIVTALDDSNFTGSKSTTFVIK